MPYLRRKRCALPSSKDHKLCSQKLPCEGLQGKHGAKSKIRRWKSLIARGLPLRRFLLRNLCTFLARFREPNRNGLLPALYLSTFATLARPKGSMLLAPHGACDGLASSFAILPATRFFLRCHGCFSHPKYPLLRVKCQSIRKSSSPNRVAV
jgi:hypothetical protein